MKNKLLALMCLPLWLALTNCGMEAVHAKIHSKTEIRATYSISCNEEEFRAITDSLRDILARLKDVDAGTTTIKSSLHLETDGTCTIKENGETVAHGTWKEVNDTQIEVTIDGKKILLEAQKVGEEIILWGENMQELCVDSEGELRIDNETDAEIDGTADDDHDCGC